MKDKDRRKKLGAGLLTGLVAAVLMTFSLLALRSIFGTATPSELAGDRLASLLTVDKFLELLSRFGGYNNLKQLGVSSIIVGQLVVGAIGGLAYAFFDGRKAAGAGNADERRRSTVFMLCFVGALWIVSIIILWPTLGTHYQGLPPGPARLATICTLLFSYAVYGIAVILLYRWLTNRLAKDDAMPVGEVTGRRAVLVGGVGAVSALASGWLLRRFYNLASFSYDGTQYKGADVQAITPNDRFYVVTKNVVDPDIKPSLWRLEIAGLVNQPKNYRFEDLMKLPATTQETTLRCISNAVGDGLTSNATWKGVPLRTLLEASSPKPGVMEVLLHGVDGYTDTFPFAKAMDPTTMVVYEMNGQPLPPRHGYPVRVIVPGMFGEKNVKWVTRIELVDYDAKGFYEQQGWGPNFIIPTTARFDQPDDGQKIKLAMVAAGLTLKGMAHAGDRGISKVEVSADGGSSWQEARIVYSNSPLAWVLWSYDWKPGQPGEYSLVVRAADGKGVPQIKEERSTAPEGATGYHKITVTVEA